MAKDFIYPLRCLHGQLYEKKQEKKKVRNVCRRIKKTGPDVALYVLTPTHGNMGDHAIAKASISIFNKFKIPFVEITDQELALLEKYLKLNVMNQRLIIMNGGGNLGTLWFLVEILFRKIIKSNPNSSIVCLPNTIFYDNTEEGMNEFEESKRIYNEHHSLRLYAREKFSYELMKTAYRDVVLMPDMVLLLNECQNNLERHGCMLCLRNDVEKTRTEEAEKEIYNQVRKIFGKDITVSDMNTNHSIPSSKRDIELELKFDEFRHARLVITDRLHGMIFAAITGTPCIVIDSKSPKVRGCYEWIKQLDYIKFIDSAEDIEKTFRQIPNKNFVYDNSLFQKYYDELGHYLISVSKKNR